MWRATWSAGWTASQRTTPFSALQLWFLRPKGRRAWLLPRARQCRTLEAEFCSMRKTAYLSLGSNLGDREQNLRSAIESLGSLGEITAVSSFYETEPVDVAAQPWFLNCAVALATDKMPRQLLSGVLAIEQAMGRRRLQPKGPRVIDIDIVLFGHAV